VKTITALSRKAFQAKVAGLWPALKGSLSLVRKPCVRPSCAANSVRHRIWMSRVRRLV
jgi:hypothetical protein